MSVLEMMMLLCFGASWPFSVARAWAARTTAGKSVVFLWLVFIGYLAGIAHKWLFSRDAVIAFYIFNAMLVAADLAVYYRNRRIERGLPVHPA